MQQAGLKRWDFRCLQLLWPSPTLMKKTSVTCAVCVLHGTDSHNIFSAGSSLLLLLRVCGLVCVMFAKGGLFNDLKTLRQLETFLKQMLSKYKLPSYPKGERTYCTSTQAAPVNLWITISDGLLSSQSLAVLIHTAYAVGMHDIRYSCDAWYTL